MQSRHQGAKLANVLLELLALDNVLSYVDNHRCGRF